MRIEEEEESEEMEEDQRECMFIRTYGSLRIAEPEVLLPSWRPRAVSTLLPW